MHPLLKRILFHGLLTAAILGVVGVVYAELASMWMASAMAPRSVAGGPPPAPAADPMGDLLRYRVPLTMAGAGFLFVAVGEALLYLVRGGLPAEKKVAAEPKPEPAEVLLEEILRQVEAGKSAAPGSGPREANAPSPSPPAPENSPVQQPATRD